MFKALCRLVSRRPPLPALTHASINTLCHDFLPRVQALNRQRLDIIQQQSAQHPALYREDSMNLYQRASLYLEYGEWYRRASCWTLRPGACTRMRPMRPPSCCICAATCRLPSCNSGNFCVIKPV